MTNLISHIIEEAYKPVKSFTSIEDLHKTIRNILRRASFPRYKESKFGSAKGFGAPTQFGYKLKFIQGDCTISFFGQENYWISELAKALRNAKINYQYNERNNLFSIKAFDNLAPSALLSPEATEELESGAYGVIGTAAKDKTAIKQEIMEFSTTQKKIYDELVGEGLIEWKLQRNKRGSVDKIIYQLIKINTR